MPADLMNSSLLFEQFREKCNTRCKSLAQGCEARASCQALVERDCAGAFAFCRAIGIQIS